MSLFRFIWGHRTSPKDAPAQDPAPREFPLASTEKLLAWPGLTPLARQALEWERGTGQGAVVQSPETSETAQAWSRLVRIVHALMTHQDLALPPQMQWALSVNSSKVLATPPAGKGVSVKVVATPRPARGCRSAWAGICGP